MNTELIAIISHIVAIAVVLGALYGFGWVIENRTDMDGDGLMFFSGTILKILLGFLVASGLLLSVIVLAKFFVSPFQ